MSFPTMQKLVDAALDRADEEDSYGEILMMATPLERKALLIGKLNYQVENGGFSQWKYNGYAKKAHETIAALEEVGTENALEVAKMIEAFLGDEEQHERDHDSKDRAFYEINDAMMAEAEAFFAAQA